MAIFVLRHFSADSWLLFLMLRFLVRALESAFPTLFVLRNFNPPLQHYSNQLVRQNLIQLISYGSTDSRAFSELNL